MRCGAQAEEDPTVRLAPALESEEAAEGTRGPFLALRLALSIAFWWVGVAQMVMMGITPVWCLAARH